MADESHILFILGGVSMRGGAEISMLTVARGLRERGYKVSVALYGSSGSVVDLAGPKVEIIEILSKRTLTSFWPLIKLIRKVRPDVMITAMTHTNVMGIITAALAHTGARIVVTEHGQVAFDPRFLKPYERFLLPKVTGLLYAFTDEVVAVSKGLARLVESFIPFRRKHPVRVIYNPVAVSQPTSNEPPHPWLLPGQDPIVISVGRLEKEKNFPHLLHAFARVARQRAVKLIILGDGSKKVELLTLAEALGIKDRILLPGFSRNVGDWLRPASVFVCSSLVEAFGNAIVEGMNCGLTVVSVDCPFGPAEILDNGRYGYIVPTDNVDALADAIGKALDAPMDKDFVRARAAAFDEAQSFEAYDHLIRNLLAEKA